MTYGYRMKAIPTSYAGVNFRSRLEARWAAFFDLCGWHWEYEPFDMEGWAPDFLLKSVSGPFLVEVKPCDLTHEMDVAIRTGTQKLILPAYKKALNHMDDHKLMLLGHAPIAAEIPLPCGLLTFPTMDKEAFDAACDQFTVDDRDYFWRRAGSESQWVRKAA